MKFVLNCANIEETAEYIEQIRKNAPDILETHLISGYVRKMEGDGNYVDVPFKYKEFTVNLDSAAEVIYFAQYVIFGNIKIRPFDSYVDWNTIILDDDRMKEIYTAPEIIIGI